MLCKPANEVDNSHHAFNSFLPCLQFSVSGEKKTPANYLNFNSKNPLNISHHDRSSSSKISSQFQITGRLGLYDPPLQPRGSIMVHTRIIFHRTNPAS